MPRRRERPPVTHTIEIDGEVCTWYVADGCVIVSGFGDRKSTQIGESKPEQIAEQLAYELSKSPSARRSQR